MGCPLSAIRRHRRASAGAHSQTSATLGTDESLDQHFDVSGVALELQYELIEREGNGLGLAFTIPTEVPNFRASNK